MFVCWYVGNIKKIMLKKDLRGFINERVLKGKYFGKFGLNGRLLAYNGLVSPMVDHLLAYNNIVSPTVDH